MSIKNTILVVTIIISLLGISTKVIADPIEIVNPVNLTSEQQIAYFSQLYGGDADMITRMMMCESGGKHSAVGDGYRSHGIFQFQQPSFERMEEAFGEDLNYQSSFDQIKLATWAISNGYGREWTSYRAIMNGGRYSFYSNQLHQHFTIYCK